MSTVEINQQMPDFTAAATSGQTVKLSTLKGQKVVIYFYPKDSTPGCTTEGQNFRDQHPAFAKANCVIFGVSRDSMTRHENFKAKQAFPFELISDEDESLCRLFDVIKEKNMYGRKAMGIERSTFLIDEKGVLRQEWRKVSVKGHVDDVLEAVKGL
ncbi:MAG: peroxiredoxin [Gammaproteobacteria bacterium]|nr:peroxiredoxin [Gammaproteobacteria bacterium]